MENMVQKIMKYGALIIVLFFASRYSEAQKHLANGEKVINGNRLISVKSEVGRQLFHPDRKFLNRSMTMDGEMSEPEWKDAQVISSFVKEWGVQDKTTVRVLYDQRNIYLFWTVDQPDGITAQMHDKDSIITGDDYVQVDLKPLLPDSIIHGRNYSYTIAINPDGFIWDSYFDPYLGGFYYSSWNSDARVATKKSAGSWQVEMAIPYTGLDVVSDPGWKWNLEFHHGTFNEGKRYVSSANIGVTVEQDIMVRQPAFLSYYWARPEFLQEVKQQIHNLDKRQATVFQLTSIPQINNKEDGEAWRHVGVLPIKYTDKMGQPLSGNGADVQIGLFGNILCFNLHGEGAKIRSDRDTLGNDGSGMAAQMAGVNGVFVDQTLFQNESFIIVLQPRSLSADKIHQDYYLISINNGGKIRGTHYDQFGAPIKSWAPKAAADVYNTMTGWGAEVNVDLQSLDIPFDYSQTWGINIFRNRMLNQKDYEFQAWQSTANDFLNPAKLGELSGVHFKDLTVFRAAIQRGINKVTPLVLKLNKDQRSLLGLEKELQSMRLETPEQLREAENKLQHIDHILSLVEADMYYQSVPHPLIKGMPLTDVQFIGNYGWAVGAMGTILRTIDGGRHWERVKIQSDADLNRVKFVTKEEGWASGGRIRMGETNESMRHDERGGYAYIYHTTDGGKTWECQFAERGRYLFGLDFVNAKVGYAAGERGYLLKTVDGGKHWISLPTTGTLNWLYGLAFKDEKNGFAVGLNEVVIKTADGGRSWVKLNAPADKKFYGFRAIYHDISFKGNTGCIVGQNGSMLMSYDGGATWVPSATYFENEARELMDLRRVRFVTPQRGYAVGELGTKIMVTIDGGQNWSYRSTGNTEWLRAIYPGPSGKLITVGEREKILESSDDGFTWKQLHGGPAKVDVMVIMAHGDDAAINLNSFLAYYTINKGKQIINVGTVSNLHSSEYEETYNLEMDRNARMVGIGTSTNLNQFETGNNGANYYHYNQRLWEGENNLVRRMVAAIRAYRPDIIITHDGVFGEYDKPEHKVSGRAGLEAFETAGGVADTWPELTRLGLKPWQPKKLYNLAGDKHPPQSYPATLDLTWITNEPLMGTGMTCRDYGNWVIRNFQSQGVYIHTGATKLALIRSLVPGGVKETSVFDGLDQLKSSMK
jgi:photosystem II stability/assembly factor-like uncharacterized protein